MTRRPVSTPVRALAAFTYLAPVAIVLLALPAYRRIRLIRVHGIASLLLGAAGLLLVLVFGSLRPSALEASMIIGGILSLSVLIYFCAIAWSAIWAYQGRNPPIPGISHLADRWERALGPGRAVK